MRILSIFGTRPEAVKMAPVVQALARTPDIESFVCVTAQHRQMLDQVLDLFDIHPDIDLNLMRPNQSLGTLTADILTSLDPVIKQIQPEWVLLQGDTTTVMAAALLCYYNRVKLGHVEAGLRTGDKYQPYPEEINRRIAGVMADLHFAPTGQARQNLLNEGVESWRIVVTGNPEIDAQRIMLQQPAPPEVTNLLTRLEIGPDGKQLILITAHRRESFGQPFEDLCAGLRCLAEKYPKRLQLVYPVHLNPNVQEPVYRLLSHVPNITLLPPLDSLPMTHLMRRATLILTDSGGIQEEATSLGIPTLVLRDVTERPEGVAAGVLRLVGTDPQRIVTEASRLLEDPVEYARMAQAKNTFGDGYAAEHIVQSLLGYQQPARAA